MVTAPEPGPTERHTDESSRLLAEATELIPNATNTGSKGPSNWVQGVAPTHMERGDGCRCWDVDGNEYIDYPMARGPIVLGHNYPAVSEAVVEQVRKGTAFSTPHRLQVEVAKQIIELVPCAEMVRFAKNGNDVTAAAAKLARAHTDRTVIASQGYHGWPDVWMANSRANAGIPPGIAAYTASFAYNDLESLEAIFDEYPDDVAAVVMNPVATTPPADDFLAEAKSLAHEHGALLVFDEIVTGFRFAPGGAQEFFDVTPDLGCFAKAIANGMPLSCLAGRTDVMRTLERDDIVFSLTYGGEAASLAAAKAALAIHRDEPVAEHLHEVGDSLVAGYNRLAADHDLEHLTYCSGYGPRSSITFEGTETVDGNVVESLFQQECLKRGVLYAGVQFPTYSHTPEDIDYTLDVYDVALDVVATGLEAGDAADRLEGSPIGAPLPQRTGQA